MSPIFEQVKNNFRTAPLMREKKVDINVRKVVRCNIGILLTVLVLGVWYLAQINILATKGYAMKGLEKQIASLEKEHKKLELQIAKDSSMESLKGHIDRLQLVRSDRIEYLETQHGVAVAK